LTKTSSAVRSGLSESGKKGLTQFGYQVQKHFGRVSGHAWAETIPQGAKLHSTTFNQLGYDTFKEIWRASGSFQKVGGFIEKRIANGRGIILEDNLVFKGFLD